MLLLLALLIALLAIGGGIAVHPLIFLVLVVALILAISDRARGRAGII